MNKIKVIKNNIRALKNYHSKTIFLDNMPTYFWIEPTNHCNLQCIMCPRNDQMDVELGDLSFENFQKILEQIPTIIHLQLNGLGEPFLNKDIFKMISLAKSRQMTVTATSNACLIDEEKAKKIVASQLDLLKISMDSTDPLIYNQIRKSDLNQAINGIKNIVAARKAANTNKPSLWFNSIIMNQNLDQTLKILELASQLQIDYVRFKPVDIFDLYSEKNLAVDNQKLIQHLKNVAGRSESLKISHNLKKLISDFSNPLKKEDGIPCFSPWLEVYIQYYGGVRLCCEFYSKKYDIGNLFETPFKEIWNSKMMQQIRKDFKQGKGTYDFKAKKITVGQKKSHDLFHQLGYHIIYSELEMTSPEEELDAKNEILAEMTCYILMKKFEESQAYKINYDFAYSNIWAMNILKEFGFREFESAYEKIVDYVKQL